MILVLLSPVHSWWFWGRVSFPHAPLPPPKEHNLLILFLTSQGLSIPTVHFLQLLYSFLYHLLGDTGIFTSSSMSLCPLKASRSHPEVKWSESRSVMSDSLQHHGLYSPWNSPGQNTGVGSLSLLQGIFPTQGSDPGLPHCRHILYQLSHKRSPRATLAVSLLHP